MTMPGLGQLIRARRQSLGLSLREVSRSAGVTKGYLSEIETGRRSKAPSERVLRALEGALRLNDGELVSLGQWEAAPASVRDRVSAAREGERLGRRLASLVRSSGLDALYESGELRSLVDTITAGAGRSNVERVALGAPAPVINAVRAGAPTEYTDLGYPAGVADAYVPAPTGLEAGSFAARVVGDSMAPLYADGDIVVFDPERDTPDGCDCFVRFDRDAETTFKRVFFEEGADGESWIRLAPLNPAHETRRVLRDEVAGMYAAVYVIRRV